MEAAIENPVEGPGSCPNPQVGAIRLKVKLEAYPPCPEHGPQRIACRCMHKPEHLLGSVEKGDLGTKQLAQFIQCNILATAETIKAEDATSGSVGGATPATTSAPTIEAGTGTTAATVGDFVMQTGTETVAATVNAYSGGAGTSGTFTVTGTITAGADRAYAEVGLRITAGGKNYLLCHDVFSVLNVSNTGTLAVTYTFTVS